MQRRRKNPKRVLEAVNHYYLQDNANVHRGVHTWLNETAAMRQRVRKSENLSISSTKEVLLAGVDNDWTQLAAHAEEVLRGRG